jgi:hypothetical protein
VAEQSSGGEFDRHFEALPLESVDQGIENNRLLAATQRVLHGAGVAISRTFSDSSISVITDTGPAPYESVVLHTNNGPVHYVSRYDASADKGVVGVEFPEPFEGPIGHLMFEHLGAAQEQLYALGDETSGYFEQVASWQAPEYGNSNRVWLTDKLGPMSNEMALTSQEIAVRNGRLGHALIGVTRTIATESGLRLDYLEETPAQIDGKTLAKIEDPFKDFALALATRIGEVKGMSAALNFGRGARDPFRPGLSGDKLTPQEVAKGLRRRGFHVGTFVRTDIKDAELAVVTGTRRNWRTEETLAIYENPAGAGASQPAGKWHAVRGLARASRLDMYRVQEPIN